MPSSYGEIERTYPPIQTEVETTSVQSMVVEIDESRRPFELYKDERPATAVKARITRRHTFLSSGNIAAKQRLRKKRRSKPPKEVSVNILRSTGSFVGKTVVGTVKTVSGTVNKAKGAFAVVKGSTGRMVKKFKSKGDKDKDKEDVLHKYIYDMHLPESEDVRSDYTVSGVGPVASERGKGPMAGRRQTWTNLGSVLDFSEADIIMDHGGADGKDAKLGTIEELHEPSQYGFREQGNLWNSDYRRKEERYEKVSSEDPKVAPTLQMMANFLHSMKISPTESNVALEDVHSTADSCHREAPSHAVEQSSPQQFTDYSHVDSNTFQSPKSQPEKTSHESGDHSIIVSTPETVIHHPSPSRAIAPSREQWETFPSSPTITPPQSKSLRPLSDSAQELFDATNTSTTFYSTISDPIKPSTSTHPILEPEITRSSSYFLQPDESESCEESSSTDILPVQERQVSSIYSNKPSQSFEHRILSSHSDNDISEPLDVKEISIPALESWKWAPPAPQTKKEVEGTRSVRDRVRELDLAIDNAFSFDGRGPAVTRKKSFFGKWRAK
jgi:hypothetical protein